MSPKATPRQPVTGRPSTNYVDKGEETQKTELGFELTCESKGSYRPINSMRAHSHSRTHVCYTCDHSIVLRTSLGQACGQRSGAILRLPSPRLAPDLPQERQCLSRGERGPFMAHAAETYVWWWVWKWHVRMAFSLLREPRVSRPDEPMVGWNGRRGSWPCY